MTSSKHTFITELISTNLTVIITLSKASAKGLVDDTKGLVDDTSQ